MIHVTCTREHTISCGHRVTNHESKCAQLHGHNYTVHITCQATALDAVGRVVDFSVIKAVCCAWLEDTWDHKFLMWEKDPYLPAAVILPGVVAVPFNPTAENMAAFLLAHFNNLLLLHATQHLDKPRPTVECTAVRVIETPKCWADIVVNTD